MTQAPVPATLQRLLPEAPRPLTIKAGCEIATRRDDAMMKLLSVGFLGLLVWSQAIVGPELSLRPLSMFRDGDYGVVGYALFAVLCVIGIVMLTAQRRAERYGGTAAFAIALALLLIVAATPSLHPVHEAAAAVLLFTLFAYYAGLLILAERIWLYLHLAMPLGLVPLLSWGYGPWQKGVIVYLLLVINVHWHLLQAGTSQPHRARPAALRRRVVYVVEPGEMWGRRKQLSGSSCG
jgi:hypothetical protein